MNELIVKVLPNIIDKLINKLLSSDHKKNDIDIDSIENRIKNHLIEVANWSSRIEIHGISKALSTTQATVPLSIQHEPRKFKRPNISSETISESEILDIDGNLIILGDPGAGKTTTIKRIAYGLLTGNGESFVSENLYQYPIVIRLRRLKDGENLLTNIANIMGVGFETVEILREVNETREVEISEKEIKEMGRSALNNNEKEIRNKSEEQLLEIGRKVLLRKNNIFMHEYIIPKDEKIGRLHDITMKVLKRKINYKKKVVFIEHRAGKRLLIDVLADIINDSYALILLDGLDEVNLPHKADIEDDIEALGLKLANSKILVTLRSGNYNRNINGFDVVQLCDLDLSQTKKIISCWSTENEDFLKRLDGKPYRDLADRPLFLTQLLVIYSKYRYLPEQAKDIYKMMIDLVLREWDSRKGIHRHSGYAGFSPEKKMEFLSKLAYYITYKIKRKVFTHNNLVECYNAIHEGFNLPADEANEVAEEIEAHTGLIISFYGGSYEFSHLSLQEYLCASYLVTSPITPVMGRYMEGNSTPLAVAVSLSLEPSNWLAALILNERIFHSINEHNLIPFFSRLKQEKPYFIKSELLGFAILKLIGIFSRESERKITPYLEWLYSLPPVKESVNQVIEKYYILLPIKFNSEAIDLQIYGKSWNKPYDVTLNAPEHLFIRGRFAVDFKNLIPKI